MALTAALLSSSALGMFVWRLTRLDDVGPDRLVAQLRLAQWASLLLGATAGISFGLTIAHETSRFGAVEVMVGAAFLIAAAIAMLREPRTSLVLLSIVFVLHALFVIAHRPGGLPPVAPEWYAIGSAIYDVIVAGLCFAAARR
jgi:hypothetical protein